MTSSPSERTVSLNFAAGICSPLSLTITQEAFKTGFVLSRQEIHRHAPGSQRPATDSGLFKSICLREKALALQLRHIDIVPVDQTNVTNACPRQIIGNRRTDH